MTAELADGRSPVREYVDAHLGRTTDVSRRHRDAAGGLLVPAGGANPGTLGAAFDFALRLLWDPVPNLRLAAYGARAGYCGPQVAAAFDGLVQELGGRVEPDDRPVAEPMAVPARDRQLLLRAAWALALLTEVYRMGGLHPQSPLAAPARGVGSVDLLALSPAVAVTELGLLVERARQRLLPELATRPAPCLVRRSDVRRLGGDAGGRGPHRRRPAAGGQDCAGGEAAGRQPPDPIEPATFRQLLGYALLDLDDAYGIRELGVYDARYGHLSTWPITDLLTETTGRPVDIAAARRTFRRLLAHTRTTQL